MSEFESKLATLSEKRRTELSRVHEAMLRAAAEARRIAIETNTGIVVVKAGKRLFISAEQLRRQKA